MNHVGLPAAGGQGTRGTSPGSNAPATSGSAALQGASLAFQKKKQQQIQEQQLAHGGHNGGGASGGGSGRHLGAGNVGENGALVAATLSAQSTGGSATGLPDMDSPHARSIVAARQQQWGHHSAGLPIQHHLHHQQGAGKVDTKNPSFIAATLAASRSASPNPNPHPAAAALPTTTLTPRRKHSIGAGSVLTSPEAVDSGSIPPTGSLISMFEQGKGIAQTSPGDPVKRASPKRNSIDVGLRHEMQRLPPVKLPMDTQEKPLKPIKPATTKSRPSTPPPKPSVVASQPLVVSPKPTRPSKPSLPPQITQSATGPATTPRKSAEDPGAGHTRKKSDAKPATPAKPVLAVQSVQQPVPPVKPPRQTIAGPTPPKPRKINKTSEVKPVPSSQFVREEAPPPLDNRINRTLTNKAKPVSSSQAVREVSPPPIDAQMHRTMTNESIDNFVSAPTSPEPEPEPEPKPEPPLPRRVPPARKQATASAPSSPTRAAPWPYRMKSPSTQTLNVNALSNAIVAGSLASSRVTPSNTGSSQPPPLPSRQRSPRLKQTLRKAPQSSDESDDQHRKKHRHKLRSGKHHAHHEGSRKKWRDEIRERERKRYEAVWASNRGMLLPAITIKIPDMAGNGIGSRDKDLTNCVANVVVREIWRRSRLPEDELGEVWSLVDRDRRGMLDKQEFVVGMWLIDQRLKGRKLPAKVSDSVWGSVNGLRVKRPKR